MVGSTAGQKRALLIVDVQNGMFSPPVARAQAVLGYVRELIATARRQGVQVIYVQHCDEGAVPGSEGWQIEPSIAPQAGDAVVLKQEPDAFAQTPLLALLRGLEVNELVVAGFQSELCIDATCRRAVDLGFAVILAQDAHSTYDDGAVAASTLVATVNRGLGYVLKVRPVAAITW